LPYSHHFAVVWHDTGEASYNTTQSITRLFENASTDVDGIILSGKCRIQ
jgi:hypothetical protein